MNRVFGDDDLERLENATYRLLDEVGLKVEHDALEQLLKQSGCRRKADGRFAIPRSLVREMLDARQGIGTGTPKAQSRHEEACIDVLFSPGPTSYYDYESGETRPTDGEFTRQALAFADAEPRIKRVHALFRPDRAPETGALEDLVDGLKVTRKVCPVDAMDPRQVKYLIEISEIVTGEKGATEYLGGSQCMHSLLILGNRSAW